jgi:hypothetical protein
MNDLEERLRTVTRAAADQITPERIPPLRAPAPGRIRRAGLGLTRLTGAGAPRLRHWPARLAPAAAALAVVALVAGSLTLAHVIGWSGLSRTRQGLSPESAGPGGLPAYYAALLYPDPPDYGQPGIVQIRLTATGAGLAAAEPPRGEEFTAVSAAADDTTFVASAATPAQVAHRLGKSGSSGTGTSSSNGGSTSTGGGTGHTMVSLIAAPARFYLFHFDPRTGAAPVRSLPIPALPDVSGFALSPDGASLAVALATEQTITVRVYSLASGSSVSWSVPTHQGGHYRYLGISTLSWTQGGGLAFGIVAADRSAPPFGVLNTGTAGGGLFADSTMYPAGTCWPSLVTQNGKLIISTVASGSRFLLQECSISHGHVTVTVPGRAVSYQHIAVDLQGPLWASPTGQKIILAGTYRAMHWGVVGVLHGRVLDGVAEVQPIPTFGVFPGPPVSW